MKAEQSARAINRALIAICAALILSAATVLAVLITGGTSWSWSPHAPKPFALGEGTFSLIGLSLIGFGASSGDIQLIYTLADWLVIAALGFGFYKRSRIVATTLFAYFVIDHLLFLLFDFEFWGPIARVYWAFIALTFGTLIFQGLRAIHTTAGTRAVATTDSPDLDTMASNRVNGTYRAKLVGSQIDSSLGIFANFWRGNYPLITTYWLLGWLGSVPVAVIVGFSLALLESSALVLAPNILLWAWQIFISVATWRSADRYTRSSLWQTMARVTVIAGLLLTAYTTIPFPRAA
jgi:hypothetical protein